MLDKRKCLNNTTQAGRNTTQGTTQATQGTTQTNECVGLSEERGGNVPQNVPRNVPLYLQAA